MLFLRRRSCVCCRIFGENAPGGGTQQQRPGFYESACDDTLAVVCLRLHLVLLHQSVFFTFFPIVLRCLCAVYTKPIVASGIVVNRMSNSVITVRILQEQWAVTTFAIKLKQF